MNAYLKTYIVKILPVLDVLLIPFVFPSAWLLKQVRRAGVHRLPLCKKALLMVGVFPVRNHYFEPQFDYKGAIKPFSEDRSLPGLDWNDAAQLNFLSTLSYSSELNDIPREKQSGLEFYFNNGSFESGDADYWYQIIRTIKPKRIIEIGSGNSTLMAIKAIQKNIQQDSQYECEHVCIEPYEMPWLEETGVSVVRKRIEDVDPTLLSRLVENDILFIDSSHVIRPQGDVLIEYLEILPRLNKGVIVHVHDIFSPKNYPKKWLEGEVKFWNEQYLLEAFLTHNEKWSIVGALNYLHHNYYERLKSVAPNLTPGREPGSFYIRKVG